MRKWSQTPLFVIAGHSVAVKIGIFLEMVSDAVHPIANTQVLENKSQN